MTLSYWKSSCKYFRCCYNRRHIFFTILSHIRSDLAPFSIMKALTVLTFCFLLAMQSSFAEECEYTMTKMCSLTPGATYNERGCWYTCRIKAEFEVFSGTRVNGSPCKSVIGGVDGVCRHGLCFPNE